MRTAVISVFSLFAATLIGSACSGVKPIDLLNAVTPDVGFTVDQDVRYGDDTRQRMDVYYPKAAASEHIIVFVYGGAWRKGEKSEYKFVAQALTSDGHTVVIPDYRLYPFVNFPDFVTDVADAIATLDDLGISTIENQNKVVVMGHSSGAHTAALIASDARYLESSGVGVSALIGIAGPYDLPMSNPEVAEVFGEMIDPDIVKPVRRVSTEHPRTLLIHGADDKRVKPEHTKRYFRALESNGIAVEKLMLKGDGHAASIAGLAAPLDRFNPIRETIQAFLHP